MANANGRCATPIRFASLTPGVKGAEPFVPPDALRPAAPRAAYLKRVCRLKVADKAIDKLKDRVRELTGRTRGHCFVDIVAELRDALLGWRAYVGVAEAWTPIWTMPPSRRCAT